MLAEAYHEASKWRDRAAKLEAEAFMRGILEGMAKELISRAESLLVDVDPTARGYDWIDARNQWIIKAQAFWVELGKSDPLAQKPGSTNAQG